MDCSILGLRAKGDRSLSHALTGLNVTWMTARAGRPPERLNHDLHVIAGSVPAAQALEFYDHVRAIEINVPVILVCLEPNVSLRDRAMRDPAAHFALPGELTSLRHLVDYVLDGLKSRVLDARLEELRTMVEDMAARQRGLGIRNEHWRRRLQNSDWVAMRTKSMEFFTQRGGTAAQFERLWPGVCAEALDASR
jgi:hypothetical protein